MPEEDMRAAERGIVEALFQREFGYRDLAKLIIAVERHALRTPSTTPPPPGGRRARYRLTVSVFGSPPKFHDDPEPPEDGGRGLAPTLSPGGRSWVVVSSRSSLGGRPWRDHGRRPA